MLTSSPFPLPPVPHSGPAYTMPSKSAQLDNKLSTSPTLSQASACYLPDDYSVSHIPSATATPIEFGDEYSSPMFVEAENIVCYGELDPFIDSGFDLESDVAQADAVHEVTADEIHCACDVSWHECYDAVVVQKDEKFDPFKTIKSEFSNDDLLFAEIIDDLAISGFEEEKDDFTTHSSKNLLYQTSESFQDTLYDPSLFLDEIDSDPNISFDDFSLATEPTLTFSIGGPKPIASPTHMPQLNRNTSQTMKQQTPTTPSLNAHPPRYPPKPTIPIRERDQSQQKWKDKRVQTLNEARALDARQIATSKRERSNGKFAKRKINWVSITEIA